MKYWISGIILFSGIVLAGAWFVNREYQSLRSTFSDSEEAAYQQQKAEESSWRFAVIGDTEGFHPVTQRMIDDMKTRDLSFVVHLGDVSATGDETEMRKVLDAFAALPVPTYYVPGNNDLIYNEALEIRTPELYQRVVNEQLYYSFNHESAHMVLLDNSYRRYGFSDEELEWLRNDLDAATQPLTFLFYHRPLDVPGQQLFGDDETTNSRAQNELFKTLIADYGIDHIFNGHIHTSLSYTLGSTAVTVSGGGGALPQDYLGGKDTAFFHYYIVHVYEEGENSSHTIELVEAAE